MCGIAGIIARDAKRYRDHGGRMIAALRHRGPDGEGIALFDNALLAHTRLAIVDVAGSPQPMRSEPGAPRTCVTFNGEIYGYQHLRNQCHDFPFHTQGDTELLLALHARLGDAFVEHLPGMFAFALWDDATQTLTAARDRFGEKPLFYAEFADDRGEAGLVFASSISAILATGLIQPALNRDALSHYLQYLYVHPCQTIYANVRTLPPAHVLTWRDGRASLRRYWHLPARREAVSAREAIDQLRTLMDRALSRQLVADVPVGAFLSGGLDSSTVVGAAARHKPGLQTFAFRFDRGPDETPYAAVVARMHGTTHCVLEDTAADIASLLEEMATVYDEPFADSSNIPTFLISKLARQHLKVVLTGDGGDELLGGYAWYRPLLTPPAGESVGALRLRQAQYFSDATLEKLGLATSAMLKHIDATNTVDDAMRMDLLDYMPGDILVKIDRASMAHALELRAPFLDVDLASFLISLPESLKIDSTQDKILLRQAFGDLWPAEIHRRTKQGFGAPVAEWLARPAVAAVAQARLNDPRHPLFQLLPFDVTRIAVERHNYQTWSLLTLALWLERHPL